MSAAGDHTCALTVAGDTYCWGAGGGGQLGNGESNGSTVPVAVAGGLTFSTITAGGFESNQRAHSCGLRADGDGRCWGYLALGVAGLASSNVPVAVEGGIRFTNLNAGSFHTCGIALSGEGYCWGVNFGGSLGTGTVVSADLPMRLAPPEP